MTRLRSASALMTKEVLHHGAVFFGLAIWSGLMVPLAFVWCLGQGGSSFMSGATGLTYYYMPCVVFLVVGRLVVTEREDGTVQFMNALPATLSLRLFAKIAVGLPFLLALTIAITAPLMMLSALREFVTVGWFVQVMGMQLLYVACWFSLCTLVAHTGRFRHWIWMSLLAIGLSEWLESDWQHWTWHAALANPVDLTRHEFPWSDLATALAWLGFTVAVAFLVATFRGGSMTDMAFRGISNRERTTGTALVLALYLTLEVQPEMGHATLNGWDSLPSLHTRVHHLGEVHDWPQATAETLKTLEDWAPEAPPTRVILAESYARSPADREPHLMSTEQWDRDELIVRISGPVTTGDRARLVQAILDQRSALMLALNPRVGFAYDGLGLYVAEVPERRQLAQMRAAVAVAHGLRREDLSDWSTLRDHHGADVAAGVGALGLVALESCGDSEAVSALARDLLLPVLPETTWSAAFPPDFRSEDYGCATEQWHGNWWQRLQQAHTTRVDELRTAINWEGKLRSSDPEQGTLAVSWTLERIDPERVTLVLTETDPLRGHAIPYNVFPFTRDLREVSGTTDTPFTSSSTLTGHLRVWSPAIQGHIISGWMKAGT